MPVAWHDGWMSDDFFSLKMLIVSEAAPERQLICQAAAQASVPTEVTELEAVGDPIAMGELLARVSIRGFQSTRGRNCSTRAAPRKAARWPFWLAPRQ
jgi:hypothetical protein